MDPERLLNRFLQYVRIDTTADDQSTHYPSSPGQWTLGKVLVEQLRDLGLRDVVHDQYGLIYATIPSTVGHRAPVVALNAHLDTSPETSGKDVQPQVIRGYLGGDIVLPGDPRKVIRIADNPELAALQGRTIITSDGTTLLGADDKSGVAVIMEAAAHLCEHPQIPHGDIRILFTCDEEIGRGIQHVDLQQLGADVAYTLDGPATNSIDTETFSADLATVCVRGVNIHPSIAKGRMVNAVRVAGILMARMPSDGMTPETTEDREGFLHPYQIQGSVAEVVLKILLRDFRSSGLVDQAELLRKLAQEVSVEFPGSSIDVSVKPQYRNLGEGLAKEPRAVAYAQQALERLGRVPKHSIIRGGTDGSLLTQAGLPTPNLSTGEHNPHSPLEWTCLEEMVEAVEWLVALVQVWAEAEKMTR